MPAPQPVPAGLGANGKPSADGFNAAPPFTADDELILQIDSAQGVLTDSLTAYGTRSGVYLPLGEIARLLDVAIVVSDDGHYASGWVLDPKRAISINLRQGTMRRDDKETTIDPRDAAAFDGELYLRAERFSDLMPLTLKVDLRAQSVLVKTLEPFPYEQRAARESARENLAGRSGRQGLRRFPREDTPWRALSFPLGDVELRGMSDTALGSRVEGDLRLSGDLAFMTARLFASVSSRDKLIGSRIELGRRDPDARLLGFMHATEFQIGDVSTSSMPLGQRGIGGRGFMVTNSPLERVSVFDKIDLRGDLPDGYEAEVYRNNTLIGSTRSAVNGQFEFLQVPVEFGLNVFRLVLYGPQGQRREEVRRISVGDGRLGKGEFVYSLGMAQKDVNLFNAHGPNFVPNQDYGTWRGSAQLQYGLSTGITAMLAGGIFEADGRRHWQVTTGLRFGISGIASRLDLGLQDGGGKAVQAGFGGKLNGINWTASHAEYLGNFTDELRSFSIDPLRRASELDLNATLHLGSGEHTRDMSLAGRVRHIEFADGRTQTDASLRASTLVSRMLVSNGLTFAKATVPGNAGNTQLTGSFDLATLAGSRTQYRASLGYALLPKPEFTSAEVEVNRSFGRDMLVKASMSHMLTSGDTVLGLSAVRSFKRLSLAFDGNLSLSNHNYSATLRLGFSFGRNPLTGSLFMARPGLSSGGAVAVRAFQDENGNRRYEPGEPLLSDVEFDTGTLTGKTDRHGVAIIGQIGDGTRTNLHLNGETLPDIAMAPVSAGKEFIPRAGRVHVSEFPVEMLSEIEGTAFFGERGREVSGLALHLVGADGKAVAHTRTHAGGVFLFEQVHPGEYRIELDPNQAQRLGIRLLQAATVAVGEKGSTQNITLQVATAQGGEQAN